jgi:hypothetical protein
MKFVPLFIAIQLASLLLTIIGLPVCALLAFSHDWRMTVSPISGRSILTWPRWAWVWSNDEDGIDGSAPFHPEYSAARRAFVWSALRNPCNNLRFVRGVSKVGRPLWRKTWGAKPGGWYVAAGWNNSGFPVLSGGRNVNAY